MMDPAAMKFVQSFHSALSSQHDDGNAIVDSALRQPVSTGGEGIGLESHPAPSTGTPHHMWRMEMIAPAKNISP